MELKEKIEAALFVSAKPLALAQIAQIINTEIEQVREATELLFEEYQAKNSGIVIIKNGPQYQMVTSPDCAEIVRSFIKNETTGELSRPSLETLTIIAYRGPITKAELDRIRGVNCALILRSLMIRGLVQQETEQKGKEPAYAITSDFIRYLGISGIEELPDYGKLSADDLFESREENVQVRQEDVNQEISED